MRERRPREPGRRRTPAGEHPGRERDPPDLLTYHVLVRTEVVSESLRPRLLFSRTAEAPEDLPSDRLHLRPIPGRQAFYLFVRNPSPVARDLAVELFEGGSSRPLQAKL